MNVDVINNPYFTVEDENGAPMIVFKLEAKDIFIPTHRFILNDEKEFKECLRYEGVTIKGRAVIDFTDLGKAHAEVLESLGVFGFGKVHTLQAMHDMLLAIEVSKK